MKKTLLILILLLLLGGSFSLFSLQKEKRKNALLVNNNRSLTEKVTSYKAKNGQLVASFIALQETRSNLPDSLEKVIKNLRLRPKDVLSVGSITTKVETLLIAPKTVLKGDTCYSFHPNKKFNAVVCMKGDSATLSTNIQATFQLAFSDDRIFVNKRSPIFFVRWFQRKQTIIKATATCDNEAIKIPNLSFTYIVR